MEAHSSRQVDELAAWAESVGGVMTGGGGGLRPVEEAHPELAGRLYQVAGEILGQAPTSGPPDGPTLRILVAPGRIRVCVGEESCEIETGDTPGSLEEAVVSAAQTLIASSEQY